MKPCNELPFELSLPEGGVFTIVDAAGAGVVCREGCVWITLDNDTRDIVLEPGQRFEHDQHRRALVSALTPSRITVECARPATLPRPAPAAARWPWWRRHPVAAMAFDWGALAKAANGGPGAAGARI